MSKQEIMYRLITCIENLKEIIRHTNDIDIIDVKENLQGILIDSYQKDDENEKSI